MLTDMQTQVDVRLQRMISDLLASRVIPPSYEPVLNEVPAFVGRSGKRIRPLLFLQTRRLLAGADYALVDDDLTIAAVLELLHDFVLIHDDIIDRSDMRRGAPSFHKVVEKNLHTLGNKPRTASNLALVTGDILFAASMKSVLETRYACRAELSARLLSYVIETGLGEGADIVVSTRDLSKVSLHEIEQMYLLKTTRYTVECPLVLAGMLAGCSQSQLDELALIAEPAGLAFQIENDLRSFESYTPGADEPPDDLLDGKKTVLLRAAYDLLRGNERSVLQLCADGQGATEASVLKQRELIINSGALQQTRSMLRTMFELAATRVENSGFPADVREGLHQIMYSIRSLTSPSSS